MGAAWGLFNGVGCHWFGEEHPGMLLSRFIGWMSGNAGGGFNRRIVIQGSMLCSQEHLGIVHCQVLGLPPRCSCLSEVGRALRKDRAEEAARGGAPCQQQNSLTAEWLWAQG